MGSQIQVTVGKKKKKAEMNSFRKSQDLNRTQSAAIIFKYNECCNYDFRDKWKYFEKQ